MRSGFFHAFNFNESLVVNVSHHLTSVFCLDNQITKAVSLEGVKVLVPSVLLYIDVGL
jgi:hypothetical protein